MLNNTFEWIPPNPENVLSSEDFSKTSGESDGSDPEQNQTGYDHGCLRCYKSVSLRLPGDWIECV